MATERTRVLKKNSERNPVEQMLVQSAPPVSSEESPARPTVPAQSAHQEPPGVSALPVPAPAQTLGERAPAVPTQQGKRQVSFRLDPTLLDKLKAVSIEYSFRAGRTYSQNAIIELALHTWIDTNGPWRNE